MAREKEKDILLDHDYDGIHELDNDLPPWWLYLFYISIAWAVFYLLYYHVFSIGDSSYAEYMKEMNPGWKPKQTESVFSIGYRSPFYRTEVDLTPLKRVMLAEQAREAAALAKAEGVQQNISDFNFEDLIKAAMQISTPENLEKLKSAFPEIWAKLESEGPVPAAAETAEKIVEELPPVEPLTDEASLNSGSAIFQANCATCHGNAGEGGIGPNLTDDYYLHGAGMANQINVITNGVAVKGMISWRGILKEQQIREVSSYILTLRGTNPPNAKAPQGEKIESE